MPIDVRELVERVNEVCPVPVHSQRVVMLTADPNVNLDEIAEAVSVDPALAAEVMRIANSPVYGRARKVTELRQAIFTVGLRELNVMAAALAMLSAFSGKGEVSLGLHEWSVVAGGISRSLATELTRAKRLDVSRDEAFLAGLLSEIGAMACLAVDGEAYVATFEAAKGDAFARARLETERYGVESGAIGAALLDRNGLPVEVCEAVGAFAKPDRTPLEALTQFSRFVTPALLRAVEEGAPGDIIDSIEAALAHSGLPCDPERTLEVCIAAAGLAEDEYQRAG